MSKPSYHEQQLLDLKAANQRLRTQLMEQQSSASEEARRLRAALIRLQTHPVAQHADVQEIVRDALGAA